MILWSWLLEGRRREACPSQRWIGTRSSRGWAWRSWSTYSHGHVRLAIRCSNRGHVTWRWPDRLIWIRYAYVSSRDCCAQIPWPSVSHSDLRSRPPSLPPLHPQHVIYRPRLRRAKWTSSGYTGTWLQPNQAYWLGRITWLSDLRSVCTTVEPSSTFVLSLLHRSACSRSPRSASMTSWGCWWRSHRLEYRP